MSSFVKFWALKELKTKMSRLLELRKNAVKAAEMQNELSRLRMLRGILMEVQQRYGTREKGDEIFSKVWSNKTLDYEELIDQLLKESKNSEIIKSEETSDICQPEAPKELNVTEWNVADDLAVVRLVEPKIEKEEIGLSKPEDASEDFANVTGCNVIVCSVENKGELSANDNADVIDAVKQELAKIHFIARTSSKVYEVTGSVVTSNTNPLPSSANEPNDANDPCKRERPVEIEENEANIQECLPDKNEELIRTEERKSGSLPEVILPEIQMLGVVKCSNDAQRALSTMSEDQINVNKTNPWPFDKPFGHYLHIGCNNNWDRELHDKQFDENDGCEITVDNIVNASMGRNGPLEKKPTDMKTSETKPFGKKPFETKQDETESLKTNPQVIFPEQCDKTSLEDEMLSQTLEGIEDISRMSQDKLDKLQKIEEQLEKFSRNNRKHEMDTEPLLGDDFSFDAMNRRLETEHAEQNELDPHYIETFLMTKCVKLQEIAEKLEALQSDDISKFKEMTNDVLSPVMEKRREQLKANAGSSNAGGQSSPSGKSLNNESQSPSGLPPGGPMKPTYTQEELQDLIAEATDYICDLIEKFMKAQKNKKLTETERPNSKLEDKPKSQANQKPEVQILEVPPQQPNKEAKVHANKRKQPSLGTPQTESQSQSKSETQMRPDVMLQFPSLALPPEVQTQPKCEREKHGISLTQSETEFVLVSPETDTQAQSKIEAQSQPDVQQKPPPLVETEIKWQKPSPVQSLSEAQVQPPPLVQTEIKWNQSSPVQSETKVQPPILEETISEAESQSSLHLQTEHEEQIDQEEPWKPQSSVQIDHDEPWKPQSSVKSESKTRWPTLKNEVEEEAFDKQKSVQPGLKSDLPPAQQYIRLPRVLEQDELVGEFKLSENQTDSLQVSMTDPGTQYIRLPRVIEQDQLGGEPGPSGCQMISSSSEPYIRLPQVIEQDQFGEESKPSVCQVISNSSESYIRLPKVIEEDQLGGEPKSSICHVISNSNESYIRLPKVIEQDQLSEESKPSAEPYIRLPKVIEQDNLDRKIVSPEKQTESPQFATPHLGEQYIRLPHVIEQDQLPKSSKSKISNSGEPYIRLPKIIEQDQLGDKLKSPDKQTDSLQFASPNLGEQYIRLPEVIEQDQLGAEPKPSDRKSKPNLGEPYIRLPKVIERNQSGEQRKPPEHKMISNSDEQYIRLPKVIDQDHLGKECKSSERHTDSLQFAAPKSKAETMNDGYPMQQSKEKSSKTVFIIIQIQK